MKALRMSAAVTSRSDGLSERACCGRERMARQTAYRAVLCERSSLTAAASAKGIVTTPSMILYPWMW